MDVSDQQCQINWEVLHKLYECRYIFISPDYTGEMPDKKYYQRDGTYISPLGDTVNVYRSTYYPRRSAFPLWVANYPGEPDS